MEMMDGQMVEVDRAAFHLGFPANAKALILTEIDGLDELLDGQMNQIVEISRRHGDLALKSSKDPEARAKLWKAQEALRRDRKNQPELLHPGCLRAAQQIARSAGQNRRDRQ